MAQHVMINSSSPILPARTSISRCCSANKGMAGPDVVASSLVDFAAWCWIFVFRLFESASVENQPDLISWAVALGMDGLLFLGTVGSAVPSKGKKGSSGWAAVDAGASVGTADGGGGVITDVVTVDNGGVSREDAGVVAAVMVRSEPVSDALSLWWSISDNFFATSKTVSLAMVFELIGVSSRLSTSTRICLVDVERVSTSADKPAALSFNEASSPSFNSTAVFSSIVSPSALTNWPLHLLRYMPRQT